ncbi:hypothetical protein Tco_1366660 [Tanacetum coccineum]
MSTLTSDVLAAGSKNRPPMLEKGNNDTWQSRMLEIVILGNAESGRAIEKKTQTLADQTNDEMEQKECDIKVANIILKRLPNNIYTLLNHMKIANAI